MAEDKKEVKPGKGKPEKFITIIVDGKEKKITTQSKYILDMLMVEE